MPQGGFYIARARTTRVLILGREFLVSSDPAPAAELIKKTTKIYPYETGGIGTSIAQFLSGEAKEPATSLDPELMGPLAAIFIIKGKTFAPDARMKKNLTEALALANATSRNLLMKPRDPDWYYYPGSAWCVSDQKLACGMPFGRVTL
jgi:hypothetical protein